MHTVVCLCVLFCSGRKFGISQHRLVSAVGDQCCVFQNHDYFLHYLLLPLSHPKFHLCVRVCT